MKNIIQKKALLSILLLLLTFPAMAQFGETPDEEDEEDAPLNPVPIDDYIVPLLLAGIATGYYFLSKKKNVAS